MHHLRVITNSELRTRRRCAREHHYSYELGYRAARDDVDALRFGTLIHLGLEQWWAALGREPEQRLYCALAAIPYDVEPFERVRVVELLRGYDIRWRDEPLEPVLLRQAVHGPAVIVHALPAVECEFRAPLINPETGHASQTFKLGGKLDVLARDLRDGRFYIIEHKTTSKDLRAGSRYWQLLQLDTQVSTYYAGARALGFEPAGVIYDVLGKPRQRPCLATPEDKRKINRKGELYHKQRDTDESPETYAERVRDAIANEPHLYYARGTVVRFEQEEQDAMFDTWQHARAIREAELSKRWPRNPEACERFNRLCPYFDVCTDVTGLDDQTKFRRIDNVHEELTQEIDQHGSTDSSRTTDHDHY